MRTTRVLRVNYDDFPVPADMTETELNQGLEFMTRLGMAKKEIELRTTYLPDEPEANMGPLAMRVANLGELDC
ncbi:MAG: hypothetical protein ACP5SH_25455 [Syntrophobacteraceae bacterium]